MPRLGGIWILLMAMAFPARVPAAARSEALVEVSINGEKRSDGVLIEMEAGSRAWVRKSDLQAWGVTLASDSPLAALPPDAFIELSQLPGVGARLDAAASHLSLDVQPALLNAHRFRAGLASDQPTSSPLAAFLNYDLAGFRVSGPPTLRASSELGVVYGNWIARSASLASVAGGVVRDIRLDSNFTADYPSSRTSLQWGDTFARLGTNADSVRVGGVSWGTDFSVTPSFITVPLPTVSSLSASPGAVDLYVNGNKTQQLNVPAGPYSIAQIPVTTGAGELTIVTRDLAGRVQTFTQSYYIAPQMLAAGLSAWDWQFGSKRLGYAQVSDSYRGWLAAGGQRFGVSDRLTAQWRLEADETGMAVSGQALALAGGGSLLTVSPSCAHVQERFGCQVEVGWEHDRPQSGYGVDLSGTTSRFEPVAATLRSAQPRWQVLAHGQVATARGTSGLASIVWRELPTGEHAVNLNVSAGRTFSRGGHLDLLWSQDLTAARSSFFTLLYTRSLGHNRSASASLYNAAGRWGAAVTTEQSLPPGEGWGYQLRAAQDSLNSLQAIGQWNGSNVAVSADLERQGALSIASLDVSGAAVLIGDHLLTSRRLDQSFAIIRAEPLQDAAIYLNGQKAAHTNSAGWAVLPEVRAFVPNRVALDPTAIPLDLSVPQTRFEVIPYRRGAALVDVPVYLGATVRLLLADGVPLPAGTRVFIGKRSTPVGTHGLTYLESGRGRHRLTAEWDGGSCHAELTLPLPPAEMLGTQGEATLTCAP